MFQIFNEIYKCDQKFYEIINDLNNSYYNCTDGMSDELRYGMTKYNKKEETFIIIERNRTMIYDSRIGFLDIKALSLKDKLQSSEVFKIRITIITNNYQFYFNKFLKRRSIKIQNDVLTKETIKANDFRILSCFGGIAGTCLLIYNF